MEELLKELAETKAKIADIEKKIEEKKSETRRWKPRTAEEYWWIPSVGEIGSSIWDDDEVDNGRWRIGNCYQTEEECEFAIEKLKVIAKLKEYEEPKNSVWDEKSVHYYIYYDYTIEEVSIGCTIFIKRNESYFESREKARQAIDAVEEKRIKKYYLGVKEE